MVVASFSGQAVKPGECHAMHCDITGTQFVAVMGILVDGLPSGSGNVASGQQSDHLLMVAAFNGWQAARGQVLS